MMSPNGVVVLYASCLGGFLAVAGALTFQAGQPQAAWALFAAAFSALFASLVTSLIVLRANAVQAKARAGYVKRYGEDPWHNEQP